jgi:inorganic pyrophosphatase
MFGTKNYGEIIGYTVHSKLQTCINSADGDPWDVIVAGYNKSLPRYTPMRIKDIIGVFELENGNHKLVIDVYVPERYAIDNVHDRDIKEELFEYADKYTQYTGVKGKVLWF